MVSIWVERIFLPPALPEVGVRGIDDREREHRLFVQPLLRERPGPRVRQLLELHQHLLLLRHHLRGNGDAVPPLRLRDDPYHLTPAPHCPIR